ncbi:MAG: recombinase family protein [Pseudorhodoplanes sp.]|nr:recombinase family protein [Pseudorhodoplanes sp.]
MAKSEQTPRRPIKRSRCAIYTRKSTDEGLEQAFNSLDAQREACAAFILSQKHEGWTVLPTLYDDGGYSGGTMERPALQRLLADIEAGQIDVIVVYKVDRLTRALSDFAKLVEVFDRRGVSFVSITQQFNTTTSMGRLTLNILLSFAQFERELIGERVRDKVAASKKKGMWMGGTVPLGFDAKDRKLVINKAEARTVVDIYRRYIRLKSVRALQVELDTAGIRSKRRVRPDGTDHGNQRFSQGALYLLLQNRTYRGEATHKGNAYPGEHAAIVDKPLWDAVQAVLADNRVQRASGVNTKAPSLLTGLLFDEAGERLTPTWSVKKGTRYRYYVSTSLVKGGSKADSTRRRIPAGNLETIVMDRLRRLLSSRGELLDAIEGASIGRTGQGQLIQRGRKLAEELGQTPEKNRTTVTALVRRVEIGADSVKIDVSRDRLAALFGSEHEEVAHNEPIDPSGHILTLTAPVQLTRVGREMKLLVDDSNDHRSPDMSLLRVLTRAHDVQQRLAEDTALTVHDIARDERVTPDYLYIVLRLRWLAPDITSAIINGRQPAQLNAKRLMRLTAQLPADWSAQRALLGFR